MNRSKKWSALLLTVLMLINCISITAFAAGSKPVLLSAPQNAMSGADVRVNVESSSTSVADGKLVITYDASKLSFVGLTAGTAWANAGSVVHSVNHTSGKVILTFAGEEAAMRGILFSLTFTPFAEGEAAVTLDGSSSYITGVDQIADQTAAIAVQSCEVPAGHYRVVFDQGDHGTLQADELAVRDIPAGSKIGTVPAVTADLGYALIGWLVDGVLYSAAEVAQMSFAEDEIVTVTAQYELDSPAGTFPVVLEAGTNGTFISGNTVTIYVGINTSLAVSQVPVPVAKTGYHFTHWVCKSTGAVYTTDELLRLVITEPMSFEAVFARTVTPTEPTPPQPPVDPDDKDDENPDIIIEVPELTEERYSAIVAQYPDAKDHWAEENIVKAINAGLFNGTGANTFSPDGVVTRGMFVTLLYRLSGAPEVNDALSFTDVDADQYYADAVNWASSNGIVNGMSAAEFAPGAEVSREQMVTMLYRYAQYIQRNTDKDTKLNGFGDSAEVSNWAEAAMKWAVAEGIITGSNGNLNPADESTRAQIATVLVRFAGL